MAQTDGKELAVSVIPLGDFNLQFTAAVIIGAGNRQISLSVPDVRAGDILAPRITAAIPDGYAVSTAFCVANGTAVIVVSHPALALGASFNIPIRLFKIMS